MDIEKVVDQNWGDIRCCPAHDCDYREGLIEAIRLMQQYLNMLDEPATKRPTIYDVRNNMRKFLKGLSDD